MDRLTLKNLVVVGGENDEPLYQNIIEILSPKIIAPDPLSASYDSDKAALKKEITQLFQQSISLAVADIDEQLVDRDVADENPSPLPE